MRCVSGRGNTYNASSFPFPPLSCARSRARARAREEIDVKADVKTSIHFGSLVRGIYSRARETVLRGRPESSSCERARDIERGRARAAGAGRGGRTHNAERRGRILSFSLRLSLSLSLFFFFPLLPFTSAIDCRDCCGSRESCARIGPYRSNCGPHFTTPPRNVEVRTIRNGGAHTHSSSGRRAGKRRMRR